MKWVIGDVHGCIFTLDRLLAKIRSVEANPQIHFVGDYLDRGMYSKQTVERILELKSQGAKCIRGNHDDVLDYIVNGHSMSQPGEWVTLPPTIEKVISWWMRHGLEQTCVSYGIDIPPLVTGPYGSVVSGPDAETVTKELVELMPESHREFLRELPLYYEGETFFVMHGFLRPTNPLPRDFKFMKLDANECTWGRFNYFQIDPSARNEWDKIGVFGHTPISYYSASAPIKANNIRLIDMCCFSGEGLAAYCVDKDDFVVVETDTRDIARKWR